MGRPQTVDEYLASFEGPASELTNELRDLCRQAAPEASETIKWRHPAWVHPSGTILFMISGHARHGAIAFTPSTREAFADELAAAGLEAGKGTVKLPHGRPLPADLLRRMIAFRVREHEDDGVLWM